MFDFPPGMKMKRSSIIDVYKNKAYEYGYNDDDIKVFEKSFRASINKKCGKLSKTEFSQYLKGFEKWVLGETDAA